MNFEFTMRSIQRAVQDAGGEWIGIQPALSIDHAARPQIVFRHPRTKKVVLVSFNPVTVDENELYNKVKVAIGTDESPDIGPFVSVKASALLKIAQTLSDASDELNALCAGRKV